MNWYKLSKITEDGEVVLGHNCVWCGEDFADEPWRQPSESLSEFLDIVQLSDEEVEIMKRAAKDARHYQKMNPENTENIGEIAKTLGYNDKIAQALLEAEQDIGSSGICEKCQKEYFGHLEPWMK